MNYVTYTESSGQKYAVDNAGVVGAAAGTPLPIEYWSSVNMEAYVYTTAGEYTDCLWVKTDLSINWGMEMENDDIFLAPNGIGIVKKWGYRETSGASYNWWNTTEEMNSYTP